MFSIRAKTDTCQADYNPVLENTNHRMDEGPSQQHMQSSIGKVERQLSSFKLMTKAQTYTGNCFILPPPPTTISQSKSLFVPTNDFQV